MPGWPLLLTPLLMVFGNDLAILKSVVVLIALISGLVLYRLFVLKSQDRQLSFYLTVIYLFLMSTIIVVLLLAINAVGVSTKQSLDTSSDEISNALGS